MLLYEAGIDAFVNEHFTRSAFRLEQLRVYSVDSDQDNVRRYLSGAEGPSWAQGGPWLDQLAAERASDRRRYRVRVLRSPVGDYERYECDWGYVYTAAAGEEIYVLDLAGIGRPAGVLEEDFFLLDDCAVLRMRYDDAGRLLGGEPLGNGGPGLAAYCRCRDAAMAAAVPFAEWWARHPENQRSGWLSASSG